MDLPPKRKESLDIVLKSLQKFIEVYEGLGPTTDDFIYLMHRIREQVTSTGNWSVVKERVTNKNANSMFNFKQGLMRKMLKVQYFNHPKLEKLLYD